MSQKILYVNGNLVIPVEDFEKVANADSALPYLSVPGLLWKIGFVNRETREAGGIYLFKDQASLEAFVRGPIGEELGKAPMWTGVTMKSLEILVDFSKVIRAPIGEKYELEKIVP
jgi:hypothetical protein